jgi:hypothetical protein
VLVYEEETYKFLGPQVIKENDFLTPEQAQKELEMYPPTTNNTCYQQTGFSSVGNLADFF